MRVKEIEMKNKEAEKLVCPFMSNQFGTGSGLTYPKETLCITSKCMAWEAEAEYKEKKGTTDLIKEKSADSGNCKKLQ